MSNLFDYVDPIPLRPLLTKRQKAGHARASALSPERRKEIASKAAQARWNDPKSRDIRECSNEQLINIIETHSRGFNPFNPQYFMFAAIARDLARERELEVKCHLCGSNVLIKDSELHDCDRTKWGNGPNNGDW